MNGAYDWGESSQMDSSLHLQVCHTTVLQSLIYSSAMYCHTRLFILLSVDQELFSNIQPRLWSPQHAPLPPQKYKQKQTNKHHVSKEVSNSGLFTSLVQLQSQGTTVLWEANYREEGTLTGGHTAPELHVCQGEEGRKKALLSQSRCIICPRG